MDNAMNKNCEYVSKIFVVICAMFITCLLLSNLVAGKIIRIINISLPAAVILFPITYIFGDIFTEVYGFQKSKMIIWLGFACNVFAVFIYIVTIALPYPEFWTGQEAFRIVLGTTPRILVASLVGYLFGEFTNSIILSKLKVKMAGRKLWMRTISSTIVGEAFDTIIFIFISFWGNVNGGILLQMMIFQYIWKVCYEIVLTPVTYVVVKWLKNKEGIDVFDYKIKYHIFKNIRVNVVD